MNKGTGAPRRGGRPSAAEAEHLHKAILAAAEHIFLAEGFSGASMEAIAERAATSKQTVYARFGSKERLFIAVSDALLRARFVIPLEPRPGLRETLVALADQMLIAMMDPRMLRMYNILTAEAVRFPELARMTDEDANFPVRLLMLDVIREAAARGEIHCEDPRQSMLMLQHMVLGAPLRAVTLGLDGFDLEASRVWARLAVDVFLDGTRLR